MLQLYDINHNKISPLIKYKDLKRERDVKKGTDTLSFSYHKQYSEDIKEECYIRTKHNEYVIKAIENTDQNWIKIIAKVNKEDLKIKYMDRIEMVNSYLEDTLNFVLTGTGWSIGHNDVQKRRTIRKNNCTAEDVIEEIRNVYNAEIFFDAINKKVNVHESIGEDKGQFYIEKINLKALEVTSDSYDYATRLIPIGKDGLKITDINDGKDYVENYQYSNKIIYAIWEDNRYINVENLKEDAILKLEELSNPYKSYKASVVDLGNADLGDTVTLISKDNKVKEKQRVVKITEHPKEPWKDTVEIANKADSFEEMQARLIDTADTVDTVTTSDGMIDDSKVNLDPIRQEFGAIVAEKADITDLNTAVARIGTLESTSATITQLEAVEANIDNLYASKATIEDLDVTNAKVSTLEGQTANIDTILSKEIFVELAEAGQIVAGSGIIAEGAIGSAQISDLDVSKLNAGIIDTAKFTVQGSNGRLVIQNNLLQVFDGTTTLFERVALGDINKDGSMYGIRIRGADGQTVLLDHNGLTDEGFTDGYNKLDDNSLNPSKLDIAQVVTKINEGTTTIESSKILLDNKTLDVAFSTIETTINNQGETINSQQAQISALDSAIQLKVNTQTYTTDIEGINSQLSTQTSTIDVLQGQIALKVEQTDIDNAINPLETRISTAESTIQTQATQINARVTTTDFNTTVNAITGEIEALDSKVSSAEVEIDGLNSQISLKADASVVNDIESRVSSAEITIDGIESEIALKVDADGVVGAINLSADKIQGARIDLVGSVNVLSEITGDLGTINAGIINGVEINGATLNLGGTDGGLLELENSSGTTIAQISQDGILVSSGDLRIVQEFTAGEINFDSELELWSSRISSYASTSVGSFRRFDISSQGLNFVHSQYSTNFRFEIIPGRDVNGVNFGSDSTYIGSNGEIFIGEHTPISPNPKISLDPINGNICSNGKLIQHHQLTDNEGRAKEYVSNCNDAMTTGIYYTTNNTTNRPLKFNFGVLEVYRRWNSEVTQRITSVVGRPYVFVRSWQVNDGWSSWEQLASIEDFNSSNSNNGYQKLPSGVVIQWGTRTMKPNVVNGTAIDATINFPISFPTAQRSIVASISPATGSQRWISSGAMNVAENSTTRMRCVYYSGLHSDTDYTIRWMAIGY